MITIDEVNKFNNVLTILCNSKDLPLPTDIIMYNDRKYKVENGSKAYVINTGSVIVFDATDNKWY